MTTCHEELSDCECDSTHDDNATVCRWCYAHGRRLPADPAVSCDVCGGSSWNHRATRCEDCGRHFTPEDVNGGRCLGCGATIYPTVTCKFCGRQVSERTAHRHQDAWVGDECCWDERLRVTE